MIYFNKDLEVLRIRIRDLERTAETLIGANNVLQQELEKAQNRANVLQEKLFDYVGINKVENKVVQTRQEPISLSKKSANWGQIKQTLETNATAKYWEDKKREQEAKANNNGNVEKLEEEVLSEEH